MRALTLWRPWAWAVVSGHKHIENRTWMPPGKGINQWIAIHAGKRIDRAGIERCCRILGLARLPNCSMDEGIVGIAHLVGVTKHSDSPWFEGPYGWLLSRPVMLREPIPCPGRQGLWVVPDDLLPSCWGPGCRSYEDNHG